MSDVQTLAIAVAAGSIAAPLLVMAAFLYMTLWSFNDRIKEHVSIYKRFKLHFTVFPKYIYIDYDLRELATFLIKSSPVGALAFAVLYIFAVGLIEVFA